MTDEQPTNPPTVWHVDDALILPHRYGSCYDVAAAIGSTGWDIVNELSELPEDAVRLIPADLMEADILEANEAMGTALTAIGMALGLPKPVPGATWGAPEVLACIAEHDQRDNDRRYAMADDYENQLARVTQERDQARADARQLLRSQDAAHDEVVAAAAAVQERDELRAELASAETELARAQELLAGREVEQHMLRNAGLQLQGAIDLSAELAGEVEQLNDQRDAVLRITAPNGPGAGDEEQFNDGQAWMLKKVRRALGVTGHAE